LEGPNFSKTRIVGETYLRKFKNHPLGLENTLGINSGLVHEMALLGAVRKEGTVPELIYALSAHQPNQDIFNIVQVSGQILGQSRSIFLGKILLLLRAFDPSMMEILYTGESVAAGTVHVGMRMAMLTCFLFSCFP
jgi:hypothetical protein